MNLCANMVYISILFYFQSYLVHPLQFYTTGCRRPKWEAVGVLPVPYVCTVWSVANYCTYPNSLAVVMA